jgi:hypothetical protein
MDRKAPAWQGEGSGFIGGDEGLSVSIIDHAGQVPRIIRTHWLRRDSTALAIVEGLAA